MRLATESSEHWRARHAERIAQSEQSFVPVPGAERDKVATVEHVEFRIFGGRVLWNRHTKDGLRDLLRNPSITIPSAEQLRFDASKHWRTLYYIAAEILYAVVELDMTLTPAQFGLETPIEEIAENAKLTSEKFTGEFARYFLALQKLDCTIPATDIIDWIEARSARRFAAASMELMTV